MSDQPYALIVLHPEKNVRYALYRSLCGP